MATLAGNSIASSYTSLLKLDGNTDSTAAGNGSNAIQVKTGDNDATPLFLNTDRLGIGGQPSEVLDVTGNIRTSTQLKLDPTIGSGSVTTLAFMRSGADKWRFIQPHDDSYLKLFNDGASATQMYFASNNNVGIGGTPSNQLTIVGDNAVKNIHIYTNSDSAVTSDTGARIFTTGDGGSGIYGENGHLVIQGRPAGRDIIFLTNSDASEKMRLTSGGNVGIGHDLSSHAQRLVVKKNASATTLTAGAMLNLVNEQGAGNTASIRFSGSQQNAFLGFFDGSSTATQRIAIGVGAGGTGDGHFNVTGDGKVGIGTDSPEEKIHSTGAIVSTGVNDTGATAGTERAFIDLVSNKARIGHFRGTTSAGSGGLQLYTDSVERARINASGLLNLGNSPSVSKNSHVGSTANGITISGSVAPTLSLWDSDDANNAGHFFQIGTKTSLWSYNGDLEFLTGTSATVRMKLDANSRISLSNNDSGTSNTIFGKNTAISLDAGSNFNTFIGENVADASLDDATFNVGIGYNALTDLTSGDSNIAVGALCSENITTGNENTAVGTSAMRNSTTGSNNVAVGREAMGSGVTTGDNNVAVGKNSGLDITSGANNTFIGKDSAQNVTDGNENVIIGDGAGQTTTSVHDVVVIGRGAMQNGNVTNSADGTVAVGYKSLEALTSAQRMTAIGFEALKLEDAGSFQTAVGYQALSQVNNDNGHNTALGQRAGYTLTTGYSNTLIGSGADSSDAGGINRIGIGQGVTVGANNIAVIGGNDITDVYASQDGGARIHCSQIQFPASQDASSDPNRLDDYEEGEYEGTLTCGSGTVTVNGAFNTLAYTKIGRMVHVQGGLVVSGVSSPSGTLALNLPFTSGTLTEASDFATGVSSYFGMSALKSASFIAVRIGQGASSAFLKEFTTTEEVATDMADNVTSSSQFYISFSYMV